MKNRFTANRPGESVLENAHFTTTSIWI